uniref:Anthranilate N-benzoyltransferase protein 1 n=1 Tax=Aegilops tauschii subsp. strangulata TaxID=200361 RepID=A0A453QP91_AEGTS
VPLKHFDVRIASRTLLRASRPPRGFPAVHAVSNLDLVLGPFPLYLVCVYGPPPWGLGAVLSAVRAALPAYLSRFFPFAGRIVRDPGTSIPEVACNNAGAELVVANAAVPLAAVDFANIERSLGLIQVPFDAGFALSVQMVRFACGGFSMINPLLAAAIQRRLYRIEAADLAALQTAAATVSGRRPSRFVALCAHVWKLLARAVGESAPNCRMAWIVDGRRCVEPSAGALDMYMGNVVTYASHEASVSDLRRMPLHDVAATVRAAITTVMTKDRFQDLVDWAEENKAAYKDGGKWTEEVNLGLGSPALVISGFVSFAIDGDLGFGKPRLVLPWLRHNRLGSAAMILVPCPSGDGSWFVEGTRLWPRLVEVVEDVLESLLTPVTAGSLGFAEPAGEHYGSRL